MSRQTVSIFSILILAILILTACQPAAPSVDVNAQITLAVQTALASIQQTRAAETQVPTGTPIPTATALRTPPALPSTFQAASLNPLDTPHTYIQDSCQYLKDKWASTNSAPGTVVMVVMFHTISKSPASAANEISNQDFQKLMNDLHDMGFQAIYTQQLADFLYSNAKIPERSVLLVQDDRHAAQNFTDHFLPFFQKWGWPVVNGWISLDDSIGRTNLPGNVALSAQGWVDYQAHGVIHNIPIGPNSSDDYIHSELYGSMQYIQKNFNKTPIAYIWPGGGFTPKGVQVARQAGYKLGFTTNPRGPIMFNWVPQSDQTDPQRPYFLPEGSAADPLMTLPRYWDVDARSHLDQVRQISADAAAYAQQNKATELEYYDIMCAPELGPIP
jgi:Polysaccharide deacetylase